VRTRAQIPTRKALGRVLRTFREQRNLSQEELGYAADLHRNYVGGVERGERNPTFESLARWLAAVNVTWREFGDAIERKAGSNG
jgi:transcriptional regulator with XRE-family HTH domain